MRKSDVMTFVQTDTWLHTDIEFLPAHGLFEIFVDLVQIGSQPFSKSVQIGIRASLLSYPGFVVLAGR